MRARIALLIALLFLPSLALAERVPEREHFRAFALSLINASRAEQQLPRLGLDEELNDLAQAHAVDTAMHYDDVTQASRRSTYLMHVSSDRRTLGDRVREHGIRGATTFGENVGLRFHQPFEDGHIEEAIPFLHNAMMAEVPPDDGHRRTILGDFTHVGIGLELHRSAGSSPNTLFIVADFATFIDGRAVVISEVQPRQRPLLPSSPEQSRMPSRTERIRERRVRVRTIDVRHRRITNPPARQAPRKSVR